MSQQILTQPTSPKRAQSQPARVLPASQQLRAHYLRINGALAFVEDWGSPDAAPLLAVHTAGQGGVQYRRVAGELAELGYRVIVPDMPGHGHSEPNPGGPVTDLGDYAEFNIEVLERLGIEDAIVIGCSIGGKISLDIGVRLGDRAKAIISMAANADRGHVNVKAMRRELNDISTPSRTDRTYWGTRAVVGDKVDEETRELIARMHCREDPQISSSDLIGWGTHDISDQLHRITAPTRLVAGSADLWIDPASVRAAAATIPGAKYTLVEGIGHYPMEEMTDFAQQIHRWLSEDLGTGHTRPAPAADDSQHVQEIA